jgi:hypothetical protein
MEDTTKTDDSFVPVPQQVVLVSLDEIANAVSVVKSHEESDKQKLTEFIRVPDETIRSRLIQWGMEGFANGYIFYTIQMSVLPKCSDGLRRDDIFEYIEYLMPGFSLVSAIRELEFKLPGMTLSYSYTDTKCLQIHVTKR